MTMDNKKIFLKFEKFDNSVELNQSYKKDEENNFYAIGFASTPDENSAGFIVENQALLECWKKIKSEGKNVAVYEKHEYPIGKVVECEEVNNKVLITMEIPRRGNERVLSVYEQGIYVGLSIGGWSLDGEWIDDVFHVTEFEWIETSWTDIPANENALLLEYANTKKPVILEQPKEEEQEEPKEEIKEEENKVQLEQNVLDNILEKIRGI